MPVAKPPLAAQYSASLPAEDVAIIKRAVADVYGDDAVIRSYGPDPSTLWLHVETAHAPSMEQYDLAGQLLAKVDRHEIRVTVTKRASRRYGEAKIAYRQGVIL
jgi:hypothetical protein